MNLLFHFLAIYLSLTGPALAASDDPKPSEKPCTIKSPYTGSFFDLTSLQIPDPKSTGKKHPREISWNATGWDLGYNFTVNVCGPVIEPIKDVVGIEEGLWKNVSAYYKQDGKTYALGLANTEVVMRGRKLMLNYTGGSPCDSASSNREQGLQQSKIDNDDKDDSHHANGSASAMRSSSTNRKSMVISMLCDRDPVAPQFALSYVATMDECSYFFEGRSLAACATANTSGDGTLNPGGVFSVIVLITIIVYVVGGCVYNRAVLQQRGWQQLPNYSLWAGVFGFFRDLFVVLTSSCARFLPSRRGYNRVDSGARGFGSHGGRRARGDSSDAENRLIDELNEEWED